MKATLFMLLCISISFTSYGQNSPYTQTLRGKIIDADTDIPVAGTIVIIEDLSFDITGQSDATGEFKIENVLFLGMENGTIY